MKRMIALVFVVAALASAALVPVAAGAPNPPSNGKGNGQLGPGSGKCTAGSLGAPGNHWGASLKCALPEAP